MREIFNPLFLSQISSNLYYFGIEHALTSSSASLSTTLPWQFHQHSLSTTLLLYTTLKTTQNPVEYENELNAVEGWQFNWQTLSNYESQIPKDPSWTFNYGMHSQHQALELTKIGLIPKENFSNQLHLIWCNINNHH